MINQRLDQLEIGSIRNLLKLNLKEKYLMKCPNCSCGESIGCSILDDNGEIDEHILSRVREDGFMIEDIYLCGDKGPHNVKRLFTDYAVAHVGFLYRYKDILEVIKVVQGKPEYIQYLIDNGLIEIKHKEFEPFDLKIRIGSQEMLDEITTILNISEYLK